MTANHDAACAQYSLETLEAIARDLAKNRMIHMKGSWEQGRLAAIRSEIKRRRKALA
jgi:hypothetical protein